MSNRCIAHTKEGKKCTRNKAPGLEFCSQHIPPQVMDLKDDVEIDTQPQIEHPDPTIIMLTQVITKLNELIVAVDIQKKKGNLYTQAKKLYYHEKKKDPAVLQIARDELNKSDGYGKAYNNKNVPWLLIKTVTDHAFDSLDPQTKNDYMVRAMTK